MLCGIFVLFLSASSLFGVVQEMAYFRELAGHTASDTVFLLDIDDTLLVPAQMLGSDCWFDHRIKQREADGINFATALDKTLAEWQAVRHLTRMQLIESDIPEIIGSLQKKGVSIMGLTTQQLALSCRTLSQLHDHQVDLSLTSVCNEDLCFSLKEHTMLYRKGILFTSGKSKGEAFFQFCEKIGYFPKRIVLIDDKLSHLESMEKEAMKRGVEFVGLRYGFSDARKTAFSPAIADYQLANSTLMHLLSDQEAEDRMQKQDY
jgi:hypothetical protein